jgi:hypothetical protein
MALGPVPPLFEEELNLHCRLRHPLGSEKGLCNCDRPKDCPRPPTKEEQRRIGLDLFRRASNHG